MLKANELRIGNTIQNAYKDTFGISHETLCDFANGYVSLLPIELTKEWLVKFGFKNDNDPDYFYLELPSGFIIHFTPFSSASCGVSHVPKT